MFPSFYSCTLVDPMKIMHAFFSINPLVGTLAKWHVCYWYHTYLSAFRNDIRYDVHICVMCTLSDGIQIVAD